MSNFKLTSDGLGLVVPVNVEAMCVNTNAPDFMPAPYNFSKLPNDADRKTPNLSEVVMTEGLTNLDIGVHLHWALPDALTNGVSPQSDNSDVRFQHVPDRWLINRIHTDISDPLKPVNSVKSWVIESNYISETPPEADRKSTTVPFRTDDDSAPQYRYMGRVQEYEVWKEKFLAQQAYGLSAAEADNYVSGLSAVGYGTPEFAASYANCQSIFGFYDKQNDLELLGAAGQDYILSYHVVGWFHNQVNDPVTQLPVQIDPEPFDALLAKVTDPGDKAQVQRFYKKTIENGPYVLNGRTGEPDRLDLIRIFLGAGYEFLAESLTRNKWVLPSGTKTSGTGVTHTLLSGVVGPVIWNHLADYSLPTELQDGDLNIAIGNTATEALAALIATLSGNEGLPNVELLLNALQLGQLQGVTNADQLDRLEKLKLALHASTYNALDGGNIWQVGLVPSEDGNQGSGEVTLDTALADKINDLNLLQTEYEKANEEINSMRSQVFMDWYKFMLVLRGAQKHNVTAAAIMNYILDNIELLNEKIDTNKPDQINALTAEIKAALPAEYQLELVQGPRYYQPQEPVVLFQGNKIDPPERYGGDGRFMADDTLVCRLTSQLTTQLNIPAGFLGNTGNLLFDKNNTPQIASNVPLDFSDQVHDLFTEGCLLNIPVMAALSIGAGAKDTFPEISTKLRDNLKKYVSPPVPEIIPAGVVAAIEQVVSDDDYAFLLTLYEQKGDNFVLKMPKADLLEEQVKRLRYILTSAAVTWQMPMPYTGVPPSEVYFVEWKGNPWLPFSLSWKITYYPFELIPDKAKGKFSYDPGFLYQKFVLGDVNYEFKGKVVVPEVNQSYANTIFLTPHAEQNFQEQIRKFIKGQPGDPLDNEMEAILASMKNFPPILSQALNGINSSMLMRNEVLQLAIKDPVISNISDFTNVDVRDAVGPMTQTGPNPGNYYNPIRAGVMGIASLTIVDAFGRNIVINKPSKIIVSESLQAEGLPANYAFLRPRIVQPARLQFRWLAADNNTIEMNTHPATTPVCGWLQANHLDNSLWLYNNAGQPLGSLILSEDEKRVVWQSVPGGNAFGMDISTFFASGPGKEVNEAFKKLALALFNGGDGSYLTAFMRANDLIFTLIQPENFKQNGSNAVLMGSPIAVAQARLDMETSGLPAYSQSWEALENEVNNDAPKTDYGFTKVKFPVRLGAMEQVNDGMLGYFKDGDYQQYYALHTGNVPENKHISVPGETNILLTVDKASSAQLVTLLFDPRGGIHATTGVFPVKEINLPPDMYADALEALEMAFLTTPVLASLREISQTENDISEIIYQLGLPTPAQDGGEWTWLENNLTSWAPPAAIIGVDDKAGLSYADQQIREGWLVLKKHKS